ncbi:MAG: RNase J family beta-CASP ribonuclease [Candidatus Aenigmarchaeota archaeon]|nr:RNase J family beta-CASP ribonuclease [Candidatus Aenigmarchaeota archaeon]
MKLYALGGYNEVGKNMCAIEVANDVVIIDIGVHMDKIVGMDEEERKMPTQDMIKMGALPDDSLLKNKNVVAIVLTHGHLDHIAAVPRLAEKYDCPIMGTKYTLEILKNILADEKKQELEKNLYILNAGEKANVAPKLDVEFIHMTHSIPDAVMVALHTKEGVVVHTGDYKLDNNPTLGNPPDYKRLKKLGKLGVKLLLSECVRVPDTARTEPEYVAKVMVEDALDRAYEDHSAVAITTFASHIARLNSIIKANRGRREIVMLGRSLESYTAAAQRIGLINLDGIKVYGRRKSIGFALKNLKNKPESYLIISTGNQGEPNAVLSRIARKEFEFLFDKEDQVIFSSEVIPNPVNKANRYVLERDLKEQGVRLMEGVHTSGHARREDHRDLIRMLTPKNIIPHHGETERLASYATLAMEEGYILGDTVKILYNGAVVDVK